jgi:formate dehydrogenase maturation protein FdhE
MKPAPSGGPDYDSRIRRAEYLASAHPFAAEVLAFYAKIAQFQRELCLKLRPASRNQWLAAEQLRSQQLNLLPLLPHFPGWLEFVSRSGPSGAAEAARQFVARGESTWPAAFTRFWSLRGNPPDAGEKDPLEQFLLLGFLQPYGELLAASQPDSGLPTSSRDCPRCGFAPVVGVLRPEGDGGKRRLLCSFCLQEWDTRRIYCVACGEEDEKKLPLYVAEQFPHIRVEACDTCGCYVRTIDLTKNGNAVPLVDDLAAIPLTLWAQEHGYTRLTNNLLGT